MQCQTADFQHEAHLRALKAVSFHGILIADVFGVLSLDEHLGKAHGIRLWVDLLSEQAHIGRRIITLDEIIAGGEHTARAAGLIQYGDDLAVIKDIVTAFGKQNIDHQFNNVAAGIVVAGFGIFRELTDQFLENISHLHIVDGTRIKVKFGEGLDDGEQAVILVHLVDFFAKVQTALLGHQDFQHICGKSLQIALKIGGDMVCVIYKLCKVKFTGVIKLEAGNAIHRLCREIRVCFELVYDFLLGGRKSTLKAADDRHRNDDILVLVAAVRSTQFVCDGPDKVYFGGNIDR